MCKKLLLFPILLILISTNLCGQEFNRYSPELVVNNQVKKHAFAGGLNNPQSYSIDLNNDGILDLVMMDRSGYVILPYLRSNNDSGTSNLVFAPQYKKGFEGIREWFVVRDFNQDGIADIFCFPTNNLPGIEVRKGSYVNDKITFETVPFNDDPSKPDILLYPSGNGFINIYVGSNDLPEVIDVDEDGDLDILTFDVGGSYMNYYKNYALENNLGVDTFSFLLEDNCWGKFFETEFSEELLLSPNVDMCAVPFTDSLVISNRHAGSTVRALDEDGDGDLDLLIGDLTNNNIVYLDNFGSSEEAWIKEQDVTFPSYDTPIEMDVFLGTFHLDIDNDQKRDLIASPNSTTPVENHDVMWYYKNVGTDENPVFEYVKEDLFVEDMLDLGTEAAPVFTDYNQDGLLDIIVGTRGRYLGTSEADARLVLFRNVGTLTNPRYRLTDEDYANYAQFGNDALMFSPAFGDLDGDGDQDLIVGDNNGDLYYSENTAGPGAPYEFSQTIYQYMGIRPGNKVRPQIVDLDRDGLGDIITGQKRNADNGMGVIGGLVYYKNIGTIGNPMFESDKTIAPNIVAFGAVSTQVIGFSQSYAAPYFYDLGTDFLLATGSISGRVNAYTNIEGNLNGSFDLIEEDWGSIKEGSLSVVSLADINGDEVLDLLVGNTRGGLSLFTTNLATDGTSNNAEIGQDLNWEIYPNPARDYIRIVKPTGADNASYTIYGLDGANLLQGVLTSNKEIDLSNLSPGSYFIKLSSGTNFQVEKLIKI